MRDVCERCKDEWSSFLGGGDAQTPRHTRHGNAGEPSRQHHVPERVKRVARGKVEPAVDPDSLPGAGVIPDSGPAPAEAGTDFGTLPLLDNDGNEVEADLVPEPASLTFKDAAARPRPRAPQVDEVVRARRADNEPAAAPRPHAGAPAEQGACPHCGRVEGAGAADEPVRAVGVTEFVLGTGAPAVGRAALFIAVCGGLLLLIAMGHA